VAFLRSEKRNTDVCRNPEQPCRKFAPELKPRKCFENTDEHLLIYVFGIFGRRNIVGRKRQHLSIMPVDEFFEGVEISASCTVNELYIGWRHALDLFCPDPGC